MDNQRSVSGEIKAIVESARVRQVSREDREELERADKLAAREAQWYALAAQGVPARVRDTLLVLQQTEAIKISRRWFHADARASWCIVLAGNPGCGKTTAAGAYLWKACDPASHHTRWISAIGLALLPKYEDNRIRDLARVRELVIDDLGTELEGPKGHVAERLDLILSEREASYRRTMITTNLSPEAFSARYSPRLVDRIRGAEPVGGFMVVGGGSMRGSP